MAYEGAISCGHLQILEEISRVVVPTIRRRDFGTIALGSR